VYDAESCDLDKLRGVLRDCQADKKTVVFNAAGVIPHASPRNSQVFFLVNSVFPQLLSAVCKEFHCKFVHPTTDCVFSGACGQYDEDSLHDEISAYGLSKSLGEHIDATIIRTSVIGESHKGISLVEWVKSNAGGTVDGYTNHYWNGITCLQFAKVLYEMIDRSLFWQGVRHVYSPNEVSKAELIDMINIEFKLNIDIKKTESKLCNRTLCSKYEGVIVIPDIKQQVRELTTFFSN
jgi:dTDP-4-dehydrorhamnose reductase